MDLQAQEGVLASPSSASRRARRRSPQQTRCRQLRSLPLRRWNCGLAAGALRQLVGRASGLRLIRLGLFGFLVALHLTLRHRLLPCSVRALTHWAGSELNRVVAISELGA